MTSQFNFDEDINRHGTHSAKWDMMEAIYGVPPQDGIAMWVADMDFRPPECVQNALRKMLDHGLYGYYGDDAAYRDAIRWWQRERHGYEVERDWIFTTHGLVNGTALCVDTWTEPGDGVVLFTPIYHAFAKVITANGRRVVECEMPIEDGQYRLDFDAWDAQLDGSEKMLVLCSPHNPGGRCWTRAELQGVADFAARHDLILVSDEIHQDIVMPGSRHISMNLIDSARDRLVVMNAITKTFNLAGSHTGNVIIPDDRLRAAFAARLAALGIMANSFGLFMAEAAYSPEGAEWVDAMCAYVAGNARLFDEGVNAIPGLAAMPLEATYLSWVDFSGTGMDPADFTDRVEQGARICVNHGPTFGKGGESFLRFNLATPRARVEEAVRRLQEAFGDLQ